MSELTLYIGDKNLSTWSLRPWLILKQAGILFTEKVIPLDQPASKAAILEKSPSGLVPCLVDGDLAIWDSLAIAEYLAERFPEKTLWPADKKARARARSISAEMHSGFAAMRGFWPMNFSKTGMGHQCPPPVRRDVERITQIWTETRNEFGAGGPFLFGAFSIADAMYAPVVSRFVTYGPVNLTKAANAYRDHIFALPAMRAWGAGAAAEMKAPD